MTVAGQPALEQCPMCGHTIHVGPCKAEWPKGLPTDPNDLLTADEHKALRERCAEIAKKVHRD